MIGIRIAHKRFEAERRKNKPDQIFKFSNREEIHSAFRLNSRAGDHFKGLSARNEGGCQNENQRPA